MQWEGDWTEHNRIGNEVFPSTDVETNIDSALPCILGIRCKYMVLAVVNCWHEVYSILINSVTYSAEE